MPEHLHAIVLAAGDAERALRLTENALRLSVPKQFRLVGGNRTPLQATLDRALRMVPRERIVVVVAEEHRRFWSRDLAGYPAPSCEALAVVPVAASGQSHVGMSGKRGPFLACAQPEPARFHPSASQDQPRTRAAL